MAHFEALGRVGIKWQMKLHSGDAVRIMHELREAVGSFADQHVDEDYLRATAQQALRLDGPPALKDPKREQLIFVLGEVKRWLRRRPKELKPVATTDDVKAGKADAPF